MFTQLVTPKIPNPPDAVVQQNADSLFIYHPLQISAIVETAWRNRYNAASTRFVPWPDFITSSLLANPNPFTQGFTFPTSGGPTKILQEDGIMPTFTLPQDQPGIALDAG